MATYWSINIGGKIYADYVWIYRSPFPESQKIAGLVAFYNEKVDIYLDGELASAPTHAFQLARETAAQCSAGGLMNGPSTGTSLGLSDPNPTSGMSPR